MIWKRFLQLICALFAILYVLWWVVFRPDADSYVRCDIYTEAMNGGVKKIDGKAYKILLCGLNGIIQPENFQHDEVRLQVFTMNGDLLAERYYPPLLGLRYGMQVNYCDGYLEYGYSESGVMERIKMPPIRLEWLRARLPRIWPLWVTPYVDRTFAFMDLFMDLFTLHGVQRSKPVRIESCEFLMA